MFDYNVGYSSAPSAVYSPLTTGVSGPSFNGSWFPQSQGTSFGIQASSPAPAASFGQAFTTVGSGFAQAQPASFGSAWGNLSSLGGVNTSGLVLPQASQPVSFPFGSSNVYSSGFDSYPFLAAQGLPQVTRFEPFVAAPGLTAPLSVPKKSQVVVTGHAQYYHHKREEAIAAVQKLQNITREEKGCLKYEWSQSLSQPEVLVIYELWESEDDLSNHLDSEHVREFKMHVQDLFSVDPTVQKGNVGTWEEI